MYNVLVIVTWFVNIVWDGILLGICCVQCPCIIKWICMFNCPTFCSIQINNSVYLCIDYILQVYNLTFCSFLMGNFMIEYFLGRKNEYKNIFFKKKIPNLASIFMLCFSCFYAFSNWNFSLVNFSFEKQDYLKEMGFLFSKKWKKEMYEVKLPGTRNIQI